MSGEGIENRTRGSGASAQEQNEEAKGIREIWGMQARCEDCVFKK